MKERLRRISNYHGSALAAEASKNLFRRKATSPRWFADILSAEGKKLGTAGKIWELLGIAGKD